MWLVPRDRGAESESSQGLYKLNKFFTILGNQSQVNLIGWVSLWVGSGLVVAFAGR